MIVAAALACTPSNQEPPPGGAPPETRGLWAIADSEELLLGLSEAVAARAESVGHDGLRPAEKTFVCIWGLEKEINNGGLYQYFFNPSGDHAQHAPEALAAIGARRTMTILQSANAIFPDGGPSADRVRRQEQLDSLSDEAAEELDRLDEEFFRYPDDLSDLLARYARGRWEEFTVE
jgi:hypothetical protein